MVSAAIGSDGLEPRAVMFVFLAGELLPGLDDADAVVGKFVMRTRQFNLGHVAVGASRLANLAHAGLGLGGGVA